MPKPSEKSPEMTQFLDDMAERHSGLSRTKAITSERCVYCLNPATSFRDTLSEKEYLISGLCQKCQDETFGT